MKKMTVIPFKYFIKHLPCNKHFQIFSTKNSNVYLRTHLSTKINRFHINRYGIA
ncbi:hypothetical protein HanPSC8_Chr09g0361001 [Helianthus annuus]|nr:hypothetical protein HanPSC8_Chr09g0361001 [Helianthus annuus]